MRLFRLLWLAFLALPASATAAHADPALDRSVAELAALLTDGYASLDPVQLLPARSPDQVAVFFTLQGPARGNGSWQFIAFFQANDSLSPGFPVPSRYRLLGFKRVGGRGFRTFDPSTAAFQHGKLQVSGAVYKQTDAMCCPSQPIRAEFVVQDGVVAEHRVGR